jgi:3-isopropylmalate/(R)-2-methylmalate dehydratase small subunit
MEKFVTLTAVAAPLIRANIDTDAIIPSREMRTVSRTGLATGLFAGWRYTQIGRREPSPDFILNRPGFAGARIILGGENFGCGSSREHAVWALYEYGIRAVIAPGFAPIFQSNCVSNGIVPVRLAAAAVAELAAAAERDPRGELVTVDLRAQTVSIPNGSAFEFEIDVEAKQMLLEGIDAIDVTLRQQAVIAAFLGRDQLLRPWIYLAAP